MTAAIVLFVVAYVGAWLGGQPAREAIRYACAYALGLWVAMSVGCASVERGAPTVASVTLVESGAAHTTSDPTSAECPA